MRALGKRASREEPEREATLPLVFAASPLCALVFNLLKPLSYVGYYSTGPDGNSEFCFLGNIEILGKQNSLFPLEQI